jgi:Protein of unknown function (DUF4232)
LRRQSCGEGPAGARPSQPPARTPRRDNRRRATTTAGARTTASTVSTTSASQLPRCYTQNLSADLRGAEFGPGNKLGFILTLTNDGQRSCSLDGYPGLGLEDFGHYPLPSHTFWGSTFFDRDPGRQLIILSPGETASASVAFVSGATKHAVDASYLVVTPPNAYDHVVIGPFSRSVAISIYRGNLYLTAMPGTPRTPNACT